MEPIERFRVRAREGDDEVEREDSLAVEEPLEIRVRAQGATQAASFVTTMRTPGHDAELAAGLLHAEGVLAARADLLELDRPVDPRIARELRDNAIVATLSEDALARAQRLVRGTVMGSACGVCGKTSIENVIPTNAAPLPDGLRVAAEV